MARIRFDYDDRRLRRNIKALPGRIENAIAATVDYDAAWGQTWMRTNAPWTDDTGAARSGLFAIPSHSGSMHEIFLTYSVFYGIWLEVANSGRYQVLQPALRIIGKKLMQDLQHVMDRL